MAVKQHGRQATHIDDSDITTWLQLSKAAQLQGNLPVARIALEKVNYQNTVLLAHVK